MQAETMVWILLLALGLICLLTGRGPLALLVCGLLHIQAGLEAIGIAAQVGWRAARDGYRGCYDRARWRAGA